MKHFYHLYILLPLLVALAVSCMDEKYSNSPSDVLSFSTDTVTFDTLFSGVGSSTQLLKVYNRNDKSLMISSIRLTNKSRSGFRINVDGRNDVGITEFSGISIRSNDSMYISIELTSPQQNSDAIGAIVDSLQFLTNGVRQNVILTAWGRDAVVMRGAVIWRDTTFTSYRPIIIHDSLYVADGATLTCEAGTELYFHGNASCIVCGRLVAKGELGNEVLMRGDRTDRLFSYLPYDRVPGQWGGVRILGESYENELNYTDIHSASYGILCDSADVTRQKLTMMNCKLSNFDNNALKMVSCKADVANTEISNAGGSCVDITGGDSRFTHCTLANYFSYSIKRGVALSLRNVVEEVNYPVVEAAFRNCVIAGSSRDEISGGVADDETVAYGYQFAYSLINSENPETDQVRDCVWKKDDHFRLIDGDNYIYDFSLDSASAGINIGSAQYATDYPYDRNGVPRATFVGGDGSPDAGCYEWTPAAQE